LDEQAWRDFGLSRSELGEYVNSHIVVPVDFQSGGLVLQFANFHDIVVHCFFVAILLLVDLLDD